MGLKTGFLLSNESSGSSEQATRKGRKQRKRKSRRGGSGGSETGKEKDGFVENGLKNNDRFIL
jgi:hypothetical protein